MLSPADGAVRTRPTGGAACKWNLQIRAFDALYASTVAGWLTDPLELFWVAPSVCPPLTAAKVVGWSRPADRPLLLFREPDVWPVGYAELNPMKYEPGEFWLGHLVVSPAERNRGLGRAFVRLIVRHAFDSAGATKVALVVFPQNRTALRCYQGCGFSITGEEWHSFRGGRETYRMLRLELRSARSPAQRRRLAPAVRVERPFRPVSGNRDHPPEFSSSASGSNTANAPSIRPSARALAASSRAGPAAVRNS